MSIRSVLFGVWLCFLSIEPLAISQDLIQDTVKQQNFVEAEKHLSFFLEQESGFPQKYAVESTIELSEIGNGALHSSATQWIVVDEKNDRWTAVNVGKTVSAGKTVSFRARGFWDKGKFWVRREAGQLGASNWHEEPGLLDNNLDFGFIHPRYAWTCEPFALGSSFETTSVSLLDGKDCVGVSRDGKRIGSTWASKQCVGLNRITAIFFDPKSRTAAQVRFLPSIDGNFDAGKVREIEKISKFEFVSDLSWKVQDKKTRVLVGTRTRMSANGQDYQLEVKSRWLLGSKVDDKLLADPRTVDAVLVEEFIDFGETK
jgi:hypothetical protein